MSSPLQLPISALHPRLSRLPTWVAVTLFCFYASFPGYAVGVSPISKPHFRSSRLHLPFNYTFHLVTALTLDICGSFMAFEERVSNLIRTHVQAVFLIHLALALWRGLLQARGESRCVLRHFTRLHHLPLICCLMFLSTYPSRSLWTSS